MACRVYHPEQLERLVREYAIKEVLLAIPSATQQRRHEILSTLEHFPVLVQTLPDISELEKCEVDLEDVRDIDIGDLLDRDPVAPIDELLHANIGGKVVMVTGAGGSIGSELCRQISQLGVRKLVLFDNSEYNLYRLERELDEMGRPYVPVLGSILDQDMMEQVCRVNGVDTIYHAAAYKHVPLVENNAAMGAANNVFGTHACALAAMNTGVETFVLISTDKAVRPTNVMGASKRLAELVLQDLSHVEDCKYAIHHGPIRQRAGFVRFRGTAVPRADQQGRARHCDPSGNHSIFHDHPRSHPAGAPGWRHGAGWRCVRARYGRAGEDSWISAQDDSPDRSQRAR